MQMLSRSKRIFRGVVVSHLNGKIKMTKLTKREEIIMQEAFMTGRIYSKMGEKELPVNIQEKLRENCLKAIALQKGE